MSIRLQFKKGTSFSADVILKDEALAELLQIVTKYQTEEAGTQPELALSPPSLIGAPTTPPLSQSFHLTTTPPSDPTLAAKEFLLAHSPIEVMNRVGWKTNPNKILLLGAYHEVHTGAASWTYADVSSRFQEARDDVPANFSRDVGVVISAGFIKTVGNRAYLVTRTGWNKIGDDILKKEAKE